MTNTGITALRQGAVQELTFDRPERKNALNLAMYRHLAEAVTEAAGDREVRVLLLTGAGGCFSSGNDLVDFVQSGEVAGDESPLVRFMQALLAFPKPVVAAVDGVAIGIGTTLLLHCDLIYASPRSEFKLPFVQLGVCPEFASSYLLPRLVGHARASEWLLLGRAFRAAEAAAAGLINEVVEAPLEIARARALQLATMAPAALRRTKALLRAPLLPAVQAAFTEETQAFAEALRGPEFAEAAAAFFSKRAPDFSRFD